MFVLNPADCSCPECPTSKTVEVSCPTLNPADFSCPEIPNAFCSTYPMTTEMQPEIAYTYDIHKSVSFSYLSSKSIIYSEIMVGGDVTMIELFVPNLLDLIFLISIELTSLKTNAISIKNDSYQ